MLPLLVTSWGVTAEPCCGVRPHQQGSGAVPSAVGCSAAVSKPPDRLGCVCISKYKNLLPLASLQIAGFFLSGFLKR